MEVIKISKCNIGFIKRVLGYCDGCGDCKFRFFKYPKKFRMPTMYEDEGLNYITCCKGYYENVVEPYWEERWEEYYSSML